MNDNDKENILDAIHEYFQKTFDENGHLDWQECISYVAKRLGIREVFILQLIVTEYTISAYEFIEKEIKRESV